MRYNANVRVQSHNDVTKESVEADSVMELLLLGSACGEDITVSAEGPEALGGAFIWVRFDRRLYAEIGLSSGPLGERLF